MDIFYELHLLMTRPMRYEIYFSSILYEIVSLSLSGRGKQQNFFRLRDKAPRRSDSYCLPTRRDAKQHGET